MSDNEKRIKFFAELRHRGVYQAVGIYAALSWGSIEVLITVTERFGWPAWLADAALILFLTGLPLMVFLAWTFDLTGSGLRRADPGSLKGKAMIAGGLMLVLAVSASLFVMRDEGPGTGPYSRSGDERPVIAVMPFQDLIGAGNSGVMALAFTDEVINRINAHPDLVALDLQTVTNPLMGALIADAQAGMAAADYRVQGSLRTARVGVELRVRMTDRQGIVIWEYKTTRNLTDAMEARNAQGFVAGEVATGLGRSLTGIDYCEPSENTEATRLYYEAKDRFAERGAENVASAANLLEKALQFDPDYARAMNLLAAVYQRFTVHVMPDPSQYGMDEDQLQAFIDGTPEVPLANKAMDICPTLGSAYVISELSAPVKHTIADFVEILLEGLRRDPGNIPLLDNLTYQYLSMGHLDSAMETATEHYRRDPLSPRAPHVLALVERMKANSGRALELEREALAAGYQRRNAFHVIAYDLYVLGDIEGLNAHLGSDFIPSPETMLIDPRRIWAAQEDPVIHATLVAEYDALIAAADLLELGGLIGWRGAPPWLFELGDAELAWKAMERFADLAAPGALPEGIWYRRWRHWFGNQRLLDLHTWTPLYMDFWGRNGPPNGCDWEVGELLCEWAGSP
jgi:TolB-like protein/tetratricopeptide (TPR) repeat protein